MRPIAPVLACVLACASLLSGCAGTAADSSAPVPSASSSPTSAPASTESAKGLIGGFWRVEDADGEAADTWITFGARSGTLFRPKGMFGFAWETQGDAMLASRAGWSMSLGRDARAPWLTSATRFTADGEGWVLRDADGRPVARLVRGGQPAPAADYVTDAATLAPGDAAALDPAVPGDGVVSEPASAVEGTWHLAEARDVAVTLRDGAWTATTSCESGTGANGGSGAYRVIAGGMLLVTMDASTLIGCAERQTIPPEGWHAIAGFGTARSFTVGDAGLTLFDRDGKALGTLVR